METKTIPVDGGERFSDEAVAAMRARPGFSRAMRASAVRALERCAQNRSFDRISRDSGQFLLAMLAFYLHVTGGLTVGRLQTFCVEAKLCSRGRAVALLVQLRLLGFVEPQPRRGDQRVTLYTPTAGMEGAFRIWLSDSLETCAPLEPDAAIALARFDEPMVFDTFVKIFGEGVMAAARVHRPKHPSLAVISGRAAGMLILYDIMLRGPEVGPFPPTGALHASAHELSRRFRVSRQHVMRLLAEAEGVGYLSRETQKSECVIQPALREEIELYFAIAFLSFGHCARETLQLAPEAPQLRFATA